ncbi:tail sheath protein [Asticcacaulis sp. AC460]|uniref:phage tail sheath subtilisin-like domain-containing protein n=1 Tax=Asticcacaulis sp. AC460 TaxID=1282360 RepID=UPI0003C3CD78|nr:phage tail sheath subtilisin-like domain-containing protein [Asticcacaulis sp. AC460]ESQ89985.1 tail sheath protein [Asticcacaulis sp. AC460]
MTHGITQTESLVGPRPLVTAATAVIGLVAISATAETDTFPLNTAVLLTNPRAAIADAGAGTHLAKCLTTITTICSPQIVVVRVAAGLNADATEDNIIAGIALLESAQSVTGVKPRILGVPGYDTQAVTTALVATAKKLRAFVYASCDTADTVAEAVDYRDEYGDRELMLLYPDFTGYTGEAIASAMGLRALIDHTKGWHHSLSNNIVSGVTGISRAISWNMQGSGTDAAALNAAPVTTIIRNTGYRFWGLRTCSDEPLYAFEVATRTNFVIQDTIDEGLLWAMDKPITAQLIKDIIDSLNNKAREFVTSGRVIGLRFWYDPDVNKASDLAAGKVKIDYDFTPCAPLEDLGLTGRITDRYYADLGAQLAQLG